MPIDTLVLHYTGMRTAREAIERLCDPGASVSAHYVVEEDGTVWCLVPEERRAWHAGISFWRGRTQLNDRSMGVEIVNPGHEWGYRPFPEAQMASLTELCLGLLARHPILAHHVVGHSDVAPDRKQDPGELFDWQRLARAGIGMWPENGGAEETHADPLALLGRIGYRTDLPLPVLLCAFQRHWRPERISGEADAETRGRLAAIARQVDTGS
jgi:N-acetylmuramoyl-L-alanine amidase